MAAELKNNLGTRMWKSVVSMGLLGRWVIEWKDYIQCLNQTRAFMSEVEDKLWEVGTFKKGQIVVKEIYIPDFL